MAKNRMTRRDFIKLGAAAGGLIVAGPELIGMALANRHPYPRPTSLKYLDRNMYRKSTDVLAHFEPGEEHGGKMQMMALGARRFLFQRGDVIEEVNGERIAKTRDLERVSKTPGASWRINIVRGGQKISAVFNG